MRYNWNGQPALDGAIDDSSAAGASPQQGFGNTAPDAVSSGLGLGGPTTVPEFEDIIDGVADDPGSSTPVTVTATTTQTVTSSGSGLVFNNTFGSGATQAFMNDVVAAEQYLQSQFGNSCTVNCTFDLQSLNRAFSGENSFTPIDVSYSTFVNALKSHASTPTAVAAANALSNLSDPTGGHGVEVSVGEARILGLAGLGRVGANDDTVILNSFYWTSNALTNDPSDAEAVLEHELTEGIMGRIGALGHDASDPGVYAPMDFFRYTASGLRDFTGGADGQPTYFSVDGSNVATGLQYHNSISSNGTSDGFDLADWDQVGADANATDPFGPGGPGAGDPGTLSATDIAIMQALGWAPPGSTTTTLISADANAYGEVDFTQVGSNFFLDQHDAHGVTTTGPELEYNGAPTVAGGPWAPIGAALTATGYEIAWEDTATGQFTVWNADSNGNQTVNNIGTVTGNSTILEGLEPSFNQDLNGDGIIGYPTPHLISTDSNANGWVDFSQLGNHFFLYAHGTTTGPELEYNGSPTVAGASAPWTVIGAAATATGYEVAYEDAATSQFTVWNADSSGNQTVNNVGVLARNSATLENLETSFNQDLNGDGIIGVPPPGVISTDTNSFGSVDLKQVGNNYFLYAHGTTTGPELEYNGSPTVVGGSGPWTPIGAALTSTGYEVAWKDAATNQFTVWNADSNGNQTVDNIGIVSGDSATLEGLEPSFNQDLNGDGFIGVHAAPASNASEPSQTVSDASAADGSGSAFVTGDPGSQTQAALDWFGSLNSSLNSSLGETWQSDLGQFQDLSGFEFVGASGNDGTGSSLTQVAMPAPAGAAGAMADTGAFEQAASPVIAFGTLPHA